MRTIEKEIRKAASLTILRWRAERRRQAKAEAAVRWSMQTFVYRNALEEGRRQGLQEALGIHKAELHDRLRDAVRQLAEKRFDDDILPALKQIAQTPVRGHDGSPTSMLEPEVRIDRSPAEIDVLQVQLSLPALHFAFAIRKG